MKLAGKTALITGASSGIGAGIAERFVKEGAKVIVLYNQNREGAEQLINRLKKSGGLAEALQADLRKESEIKAVFGEIEKRFQKLDILINNAGRTFQVSFEELNEETLIRDLQTNLISAMLTAKYAVPLMKEEGWIVNTTSIRGFPDAGRSGIMGYCAAKAGLNSFTKNLAMELAPKIYVNGVAPGFVETDYLKANTPKELLEHWKKQMPIDRMVGQKDIEDVYVLLASTRSLTGSIITVDGGYSVLNR